MRRSSRSAVRWFAAGLTAAASTCIALPAFSETPSPGGATYTYTPQEGDAFFALAVRAKDLTRAYRPADRHVVLVDTSASQTGEYRDRAFAAVHSLLRNLRPGSTVSVYALDVSAEAMTKGFVPPQEALQVTQAALQRRTPLGATDLPRGLEQAIDAFAAEPAGSIIYIGDGMSTANLLQSGELRSAVTTLRDRRIPVISYAVGPDTDWRLLGVLAHQTGGIVALDDAKAAPDQVGERLAVAATGPILFPEAISASGESRLLSGTLAPPLRGDRDTILLGRGAVPESITVVADGRDTAADYNQASPIEDHPTVRALALSAEQSGGLDMPAAGTHLFALAEGVVERNVEGITAVGLQAAQGKRTAQARQALAQLSVIDPAGRGTDRLRAVLAQAEAGPPEIVPPAPPAIQDDVIGAEIERQRIITQQLTLETNAVIDQARQIRQTDPADALNLLKRQESQIRAATDIDPEARRQLLRRLTNEIVITANLEEKQQTDLILRQERLAQLEAEQRVIERMILEEEELDQLIARVRALMVDGYHGDDAAFEEARIVAQNAVNLRPGNGPAAAALFTSTAADQLNKAFRLRALRNDRFLETLYQVELSHVPFPDEPPVVYPTPEVWQALTEQRKKYAAVALDSPGANERHIRDSLDDQTRLEFLNTSLSDALSFLGDVHEINIIPDRRALEEDGISIDELTVDQVLSGITLRSALEIILEEHDLTYIIEDEVMKITTVTAAESKPGTRVYPVADLALFFPPRMGGMGGMMGGMGGGMMGGMGGGMGGMGGMGMGGMGGGMGGMGGGMGMGGMGGGMGGMGGGMGMFSVPTPSVPKASPKSAVQDTDAGVIEDAEMRQLLEGVLEGGQTSLNADRVGQAFASVRDLEGESAGKKK